MNAFIEETSKSYDKRMNAFKKHLNLMIRDINRINRENRFNNEGNINTRHIFLRKTFKKRYELLLYLINHDVKQKQRNRRNRETI